MEENDGTPISRMMQIIVLVNQYALRGDWQGLDDHLSFLVLEDLSQSEIVAYVRSTFAMRTKLMARDGMVAGANEILKARNYTGIELT